MRIFLCYRRTDQYLAGLVHARLRERHQGLRVFRDVDSLSVGEEWRQRIEAEVAAADAVVVLVGPAWQAHRLGEAGDVVRHELELARSLDRRVVPVVHSGASMPAAAELPHDLAWFAATNAFSFGDEPRLDDDLGRLLELLANQGPTLAELRHKVWDLYERKQDDQIAAAASEAWDAYRDAPSSGLADVCRTAAIALARLPRDHPDHDLRTLWMARAQSIAFLSGASNTFAATLLLHVFVLLEAGRPAAARDVLDELRRLSADGPSEFPALGMMLRIFHEKRGFTFLVEGEPARARAEYELALGCAQGDPWSIGKVEGSMAVCDYLLGERGEAIERTRRVLELARRHGHEPNERAATANLGVMEAGQGTFVPYEVIVASAQLDDALSVPPPEASQPR